MNTTYETDRLILKILTPDYAREVLRFQIRNKDVFAPFEPQRQDIFFTPSHQYAILKCEYRLALKLSTVRFYVFRKENPSAIIGTVCLHDILRPPHCCSEIGYRFDQAHWHQGYAREAVAKVIEIAFVDLGLHRVTARVMPKNAPSIHLLESLNFFPEGVERACTEIAGRWEDHLRYALLSPVEISPETHSSI